MGYLEKFKKEPRIVLSVLNVIFLLMPWLNIQSSFDFFGFEEELDTINFTGFHLVGNSFLMAVVLLIPILFIAMNFLPNHQKYGKIFYLAGSIIASLFIIIVSFVNARNAASRGTDDLEMMISINRRLGFWLSLLSYLGIIVATLVIDFMRSKEVIKEKAIRAE